MKKNVFIKLFCCLFIAVLFASCSNFLNGNKLKEQLETEIEYAKADSVTVRIVVDEGTGSVHPGTDVSVKIGYSSDEISFTENSGYVFYKWYAYKTVKDGDTEKETVADNVEITDVYSTTTTIKILNYSDDTQIKLRPVCYAKPYISNAIPQYPKDGVVANTNGITVLFNTPDNISIEKASFFYTDSEIEQLSEDYPDIAFKTDSKGNRYAYELYDVTYFKNIQITCEGTSVLEHFSAPVISGRMLSIPVNTSNPISVEEDYKTISVAISENVYCELDNGTKLTLAESDSNPLSWEYRIYESKDEASTSTNILISASNLSIDEIKPVAGTYNYTAGDSFELSATVNEAYYFNGWKAVYGENIFVSDEAGADKGIYITDSNGNNCLLIEDGTAASTKVYILRDTPDEAAVEISPITEKIPVATLKLSSSQGKITPNGTSSCMLNNSFDLYFTPDSEYAFSKWQLKVDGLVLSDEEISDYVEMDINQSDTTVKIVKVPESETIQFIPVCLVRPKTLSYSPVYSNSGVLRDTRIKVIFDSTMSSTAFFWTKDELEQKGITAAGGYTLLECTNAMSKDSSGNAMYYGYYTNIDNDSDSAESKATTVFRNITITRRDTGDNLLKYFQEPYYESSKKDVLIIPSKGGEVNSVPKATDVYVTIAKAAENENNVSLTSSLSWCYFANNDCDIVAPTLTITEAKTFHSTTDAVDSTGVSLVTVADAESHEVPTAGNLSTDFIRTDKRFSIKGKVTDSGSFPSNIIVTAKKYISSWYSTTASIQTYSKKLISAGTDVEFEISEDEISDLITDEGIYEVSLTAYDNNNNSTTKVYEYVVYDETKTEAVDVTFSKSLLNAISLDWTCSEARNDFRKIEFKAGSKTVTLEKSDFSSTDSNNTKITELANGTVYDVTCTVYDVAGNTAVTTLKEGAGPCVGSWFYQTDANDENPVFSQNFYNDKFNKDTCGITVSVNAAGTGGTLMSANEGEFREYNTNVYTFYNPSTGGYKYVSLSGAVDWVTSQFCGANNNYFGTDHACKLPDSSTFSVYSVCDKYNETASLYGFTQISTDDGSEVKGLNTGGIYKSVTVYNGRYWTSVISGNTYYITALGIQNPVEKGISDDGLSQAKVRAFRDFTMKE